MKRKNEKTFGERDGKIMCEGYTLVCSQSKVFLVSHNICDVYMMRRKHENDGADAAGGTGNILLFTCIPGYQMSRMHLVDFYSQVWRSIRKTTFLYR